MNDNKYVCNTVPIHPNQLKTSYCNLGNDSLTYSAQTAKKTRKRNFSSFVFNNNSLQQAPKKTGLFLQKKNFHYSYAGTQPSSIHHDIIGTLSTIIQAISIYLPESKEQYIYGINQIRVYSTAKTPGIPAPQAHQDGFDYSCHICMNRHNIIGGISKLFQPLTQGDKKEIASVCLLPGQFLLFDDRYYYHTATSFRCINPRQLGYRDMLIIDIVKANTLITRL